MNQANDKILFPEKRVSSIGFILNEEERILLVKPSYYEFWHLPGGFVDKGESPLTAISREIFEEINLNLLPQRLMMVSYESGAVSKKEVVVFVFDFGIVLSMDFEHLKVDNSEIIDFGFFTMSEAMEKVGPDRSKRLELCYLAHKKSNFYFFNGNELFPKN